MKILVAIDLPSDNERIVCQVKQLAKALSAEVWLLHVAAPDPDFVGYGTGPQSERDFLSKRLHEEHRQIQAIAAEFRTANIAATALLVQGATTEAILSKASQLAVDMIAMGAHGKGIVSQFLIGSTSQGVLRQATCPVLIIPDRASCQ